MPDKKTPQAPSEIPVPDQTPEVRPDFQPQAPIYPDQDPGTVPPGQPDNPWPEKDPATPEQPIQPRSAAYRTTLQIASYLWVN